MGKLRNSILSLIGLTAMGELSATPSMDGFFGTLDYLYLESDMRMLWETRITSTSSTSYDTKLKQTDFDWNSAFRVGLGYQIPCNEWGVLFEWMHLNSKVTHEDHGIYNPKTGLGVEVIPGIGIVQQPIGSFTETQINFTSSLRYDDLILVVGKQFWMSRSMALTPFAGLKALFVNTTVQDDFTGAYIPTSTTYQENYRVRDSVTGVGVTAGFKGSWNLFSCLYIYGKGSGSLLYANSYINQKDTNRNPNFLPVVDFRNRYQDVNYTLDGTLGLSWNQQIDNMILNFHVGWEGHYISDQSRLPSPSNPFDMGAKPLTIHGLVVGIGIEL